MSLSLFLSYVYTRITLNTSRVSKNIIFCKDIIIFKKTNYLSKKNISFFIDPGG